MNSPFGSRFAAGGWRWLAVLAIVGALRADEVWRLDNTDKLAGHTVIVAGQPRVEKDGGKDAAVVFGGARDGLFVPAVPIAGAKVFTIEVLIRPAVDGSEEQRFLHLEDKAGRRALMELRLKDAQWSLDTFLFSDPNRLTLLDRTKLHPAGRWYWVALRYDGKTMTSFIDGVKELEGPVDFAGLGEGQTSVGVRQNKVSWFKGAIGEVRFHDEALAAEKLQRVK
jgi:hypothetical protein